MGAVNVLRMLPWPGRCPSQRIAGCAPHGLKAPAARLLAGRFFFSADPRLTCAWGDPCCAPLQALSFDGGCRSLSPPDEASRRFCSDCVHLFRLAAGLLAVPLIAVLPTQVREHLVPSFPALSCALSRTLACPLRSLPF